MKLAPFFGALLLLAAGIQPAVAQSVPALAVTPEQVDCLISSVGPEVVDAFFGAGGTDLSGDLLTALAACGVEVPTIPSVTTAAPPVPLLDGRAIFTQSCASCHGQGGEGTSRGPTLIGARSAVPTYAGDSLYQYVSTYMPASRPGSLTPDEYRAVTDYLKAANGL